jgi:hypothetical protein
LVLVVKPLEPIAPPESRRVSAAPAVVRPFADVALPAGLVDALRRPDRVVTVADVGPPGLHDWRVCVSAAGSDVCVELLGPLAGVGDLPWWHAVRIAPDRRTVVRGPARDSPAEAVAAFVDDVFARSAPSTSVHWIELG